MADNNSEIGKVDRMINPKKAKKSRAFVKDADMQIHVPTPKEAHNLEKTHAFKNVLNGYLEDVNTLQHEADAQIQRLVAGETEDLHEVMLKMKEAEVAFDMMLEIRNKLVDSYKEIMRMQV